MCAEKDPLNCHRFLLVCRHLPDLDRRHLLADGGIESQAEAEERLLEAVGILDPLGLEDRATRLARAYDRRLGGLVGHPG
jgi:hypothetical protein